MKHLQLTFLFLLCITCANAQSSTHSRYPPGEHEWFIRNTPDSIRLFILEFGQGKDTVLVLHGGFGAEHSYLLDAFENLYDKYHFIFYDQRGSLRSPCPDSLISVEKMVDDIESIRKELGIKKLNLFGHSNGTTLASWYLQKYPMNVRGMVLCAAVKPWYPLRATPELRRLEKISDSSFQVFNNRPEIQKEIDKLDPKTPPGKRETEILRIRIAGSECYDVTKWRDIRSSFWSFFGVKAARAMMRSSDDMGKQRTDGLIYNFGPAYTSHPHAITVIMGEYDMIDFGGKLYEKWLPQFPNIERVLIKNAAHAPWWDQPEAFRNAFIYAMNKYK